MAKVTITLTKSPIGAKKNQKDQLVLALRS